MTLNALRLAWRQITHNRVRLMVAIAGIAFADNLMFAQLGFRDSLFTSAVIFHEQFDADLFVVSRSYEYIVSSGTIARSRLFQMMGHRDVASVAPVYIGRIPWKNPVDHRSFPIFLIGIEPDRGGFLKPEIRQSYDRLRDPDVVLFDTKTKERYGPIVADFRAGKDVTAEVNQRRVHVAGVFTLGTTFFSDGNIITSDQNFLRIIPTRPQSVVDVGLIRLRPGSDPRRVRDELIERYGGDYRILTREEYTKLEGTFWRKNSPIGFIFSLGAVMGFIVGTVIVYQILFTDVSDHLPEYATLKAMGYSTSFLFSVVGFEAVILALLGYLPGLLGSWGIYRLTSHATSLRMEITPLLVAGMLGLTILMCMVSGSIALRKVAAVDPADVF